jgi:hypothetical protein
MSRVLAATTTEFTKLKPIRRGFLVFRRGVVATLAFTTLEHNIIARHKLTSLAAQ